MAAGQSCTGMVHFFAGRWIARYNTLRTESSVGIAPRLRVTFRSWEFCDSTALVV